VEQEQEQEKEQGQGQEQGWPTAPIGYIIYQIAPSPLPYSLEPLPNQSS
jgi:hypothetical protein